MPKVREMPGKVKITNLYSNFDDDDRTFDEVRRRELKFKKKNKS